MPVVPISTKLSSVVLLATLALFFTKVTALVYVKYYRERVIGDDGEFVNSVIQEIAMIIL